MNKMPDPIMAYSGLMRIQIDRLNVIAQNSSNVNSIGYLHETSQLDHQHFLNTLKGEVAASQLNTHHSHKIGAVKVTGSGTDLALSSDHWFVVSQGAKSFVTRNGGFYVNEDGDLKLANYVVMGEAGPIRGLSKDFYVNGDGMLYSQDSPIDKLKLVRLDQHSTLTSIGGGVYTPEGGWKEDGRPEVLQGALNNSNVDIQSDMTRIIEITRQIESLQRAMSAYNDVLDVGVNQLGK